MEKIKQTMFSQKEISIKHNLCYNTALERIKEFETYVGFGKRYEAKEMYRDGRLVRINNEAFSDFMHYRLWLRDKRASRRVPPYRAKKYPCIV